MPVNILNGRIWKSAPTMFAINLSIQIPIYYGFSFNVNDMSIFSPFL